MSEGDYHGYRAGTDAWAFQDALGRIAALEGGGGSSLFNLENDGSGNLVVTAPLLIKPSGEGVYWRPASESTDALAWLRYSAGAGLELFSFVEGESVNISTPSGGFWEFRDNGTLRASDDGQRLLLHLGSAAAPIYTFYLDANTGMFGLGSDVLGFSTGGTERWRIDNTGKLIPAIANEVPAIPTPQQIVDVLVSLGILTQAA